MARAPVGSTVKTAKKITIDSDPDVLKGKLSAKSKSYFYRVEFTGKSSFDLTLAGIGKKANADIEFLASNGKTKLATSKLRKNSIEKINRNFDNGTYYIRVFLARRSPDTRYTLTLAANPDNAGESSTDARSIALSASPATFDDYVGLADPSDFYSFTLSDRSDVSLGLGGLNNSTAANITLLNSSNGIIQTAVASTTNTLDAGTYYVQISPATGASTRYTLTGSATPVTSTNVDTVGNDPANARNITLGVSPTTFNEFVGVADPNDFYTFTLSDRSDINLGLGGLSSSTAATLTLLNSGTGIIQSAASIVATLDAGTYYIQVSPAAGIDTSYALTGSATTATVPTPPPDTGGSTFETAPLLSNSVYNPVTQNGFVGDTDLSPDFYQFDASVVPGSLTVQLSGLTADANVQLYNASQTLIAESTVGGTAPETLTQALSATGIYYVKVLSAGPGNNTDYTLNLSFLPTDQIGDDFTSSTLIPQFANPNPNPNPTVAPVEVSGTFAGTNFVGGYVGGGDVDVYNFNLMTRSFFTLNLGNKGGNADVRLYAFDDTTTPFISSSRAGGAAETVGGTLDSGTYYIQVVAADASVGSPYSLTVTAETVDIRPSIARDINFGAGDSGVSNLINVNGTAYFSATGSLWKSNGTLRTTTEVKAGFESLSNFVVTPGSNTFYFIADDGIHGAELWTSDGTAPGTQLVSDSRPGAEDGALTKLTAVSNVAGSDVLYYKTYTGSDPTALDPTALRLWRSDGTAAGTAEVAGAGLLPNNLLATGNRLFYTADDVNGNGTELFVIDNAADPTPPVSKLINVNPTPPLTGSTSSFPSNLTVVGNTLFFTANQDVIETEVFKFSGFDITGQAILNKFNVNGSDTSDPANLVYVNSSNTLYFTANDNTLGQGIYQVANATIATDDPLITTDDPVRVADPVGGPLSNIGSSALGTSEKQVISLNETIYFTADQGTSTGQLWRVSPTTGLPEQVTTLPGSDPSSGPSISNLTVVGSNLYFVADSTAGKELYYVSVSAGGGTFTVSPPYDINPTGDSNPTNLIDVNGRLFFVADNGVNGVELWAL